MHSQKYTPMKAKIWSILIFVCAFSTGAYAQHNPKIIGNQLVIKPGDTVSFPKYPELNKTYVFEGAKDGLSIKLQLKRTKLKELKYSIIIDDVGQKTIKEKGKLYLNNSFYMGSEERYRESTGDMISCDVYAFKIKENSSQYFSICIGQFEDGYETPSEDPLFVQLERQMSNEKEINLDNSPELFQQ